MLKNPKEMFEKAKEKGYVIGAFNFVNFETMKAITDSACANNSPVILQASTGAIKYMGLKTLVAMVKAYCENINIDVCLHLDHGKTFEDCKNCVDAGFNSVMIDASSLPMEENIKLTKQVCQYAHKKGVWVEAELGTLSGIEEDINVADGNSHYTKPEDVKRFLAETQADSLAVAIGTSHGAYKFSSTPSLRFDILANIEKLNPNAILVLHGASSINQEDVETFNQFGGNLKKAVGVPENLLKQVASTNVCKVNVDSDLRIAYLSAVRKDLASNPENIDIRSVNKAGMKQISERISHKMQNVFYSANKN